MDAFTIPDVIRKGRTGQPINPGRVAFSFGEHTQTYDGLLDRSMRLAAGLAGAGFAKGDRVAILMRNRAEWIESFFGVTQLGGVLVPVNYLLRTEEIEFILNDSGTTWLVYEDEFAQTAKQLCARDPGLRLLGVDEESYPALLETGAALPAPDVGPDDLALLQYTSGTTGRPKGAMHTHSTVLWNSYHQLVDFGLNRHEVCYVTPALCWAAGWHDLALATLWAGGRLVFSASAGAFDPEQFLATVASEGVTSTLLVPTVLKRVLGTPGFAEHDLSSLRLVISGGEPVPVTASEELALRLPGCAMLQVYGLSEFPTLMLLLNAEDATRKPGSTGKACSIAQVRVVDEAGNDVPEGEVGEIICKSPAVMRGYYGREEATAETIVDGWLHTGDQATVDEEGYVFIAGRAKDMIITGGLNVYPAEVERVLAQHPAVLEAAVVGIADEQWGEVGRAHVVRAGDASVTSEELSTWLREQIATFKVPRGFVFREEPLPRTTSGKVQKFLLTQEPP